MLTGSTSSLTSTSTGTTGQASADATKLQGDLNRFLTMLVTQLQNQDPLQPMDANQFTSQLVQFASVEQQINQNANLEKLVAAQKAGTFASSLGYLGATVEGSGTTLPLQDGAAHGTYTLPANAAQAMVTVQDAKGSTVYTAPVETAAGKHEFSWDGSTPGGTRVPDGTYAFKVTAVNSGGTVLDVTQTYVGRVTGVTDETGGTILDLGGTRMSVGDVVAVHDDRAA